MFARRRPGQLSRLSAMALAVVIQSVAADAQQPYPARSITFVVPFAPGGPIDFGARAAAEAMARQLGQQVVIDNKPGAGGMVGTRQVAGAKPDGYTLLVGSAGPLVVAPSAGADSVDADKALTAIGAIAESPQLIAVHPDLKAADLAGFIALAKAKPGQMNFGSAGIGTQPHLVGELLNSLAGIKIVHIPYKGTGAALPDALSGRLEMIVGDVTALTPAVGAGRLKALAITTPQRSILAPTIPTAGEAGFPKLVSRNWTALMAPAGTPEPIVKRLADALQAASKDATFGATLAKQGASPFDSSPQHLRAFLKAERDTWEPLIKSIGLKLE